MIKKIKTMLGNIIAATISILILCSWFVIPFEAQSTVPAAPRYTAPSAGAGRVKIETEEVETSIYTPETETAENEPYIASETVVETEPIPETEYVEVIPEPDPIIETDIDALIVQVAGEFGLPWELVRAVCYVESTFNPRAVSPTGDYGLMQVYYGVWNSLGIDLEHDTIQFDPEYNLRVGCGILKEKIKQNGGDLTTALMCYNRGDSVAAEQWKAGIFSTDYTNAVLERYYAYMRGEY